MTSRPPEPSAPWRGTTSSVPFGSLRIEFDDRVLRPRSWTTEQSRWAASALEAAPPAPVLELCCGAGQIGLLAVAASARGLVCVDLDPVACTFARLNAAAAGMADRVEVRQGPFDEALQDDERFAVVVADPPWVPSADVDRFPEDPLLAIDGGGTGVDVARQCLATIRDHLSPRGFAVLQVGTTAQVEELSSWWGPDRDLSLTKQQAYGDRGVLVLLERAPDDGR